MSKQTKTLAPERSLQNQDYPGLFQGADIAATVAQSVFFNFQKVYLGSLIVGSMIGASVVIVPQEYLDWVYTTMALILVLGLLMLWIGRSRRDDKAWFDCRAIAESVKTSTWRYMMKGPPFSEDTDTNALFVEELQRIRSARDECQKHISKIKNASESAISEAMRNVRNSDFQSRKKFYVSDRLLDQKSWYATKARENSEIGGRWFGWIVFLQILAIAFAIIKASSGELPINIVPVITTLAAVATAWSQMKRHDELNKTYGLAAQELSDLEALAVDIVNEDLFSDFVEQVEETISREHTMWCARRDVPLALVQGKR
ncbi:DUF4231 domain-containing protein [bacterium]|nr:DUF4231 domain-containing protein [bacterium]